MQPKINTRAMVARIAKKEVTLTFSSPIAYLFMAAFAAITLFAFFWGEAFFSRNIADVRPLFEWMPLLLIFLASALTMRLWSEERRTGTLEYVLTQPVPLWNFVLGKFVGCLVLLSISLLITLPLPITVAIIGDLDWGPVFAGYIATFLLGAAYLSVGLFVSARTQNQIVSLIVSAALCGVLYMLGAKTLTKLVGYEMGEWLRLLGTGARFDSITRGVIDLRDLYYYISIIIVFLALNTFSLEKERWAHGVGNANHSTWRLVTGLFFLNALVGNLWIGQITSLRFDVTEGKQYSISAATESYLEQLQEPLLLRGYFSAKTHHLLSPLVPQMRDLMREYEIVGGGRVRVEFIDPAENPELEDEANSKYGIQPVPFQVADRYQASIVSSYFNILVQYGDEHQTLGFGDLVEVKARSESDIDVQLRNPEHDLTRVIKKVLKSYQAGGSFFDTIDGEVNFTAYVSDDAKLPEQLQEFKAQIKTIVSDNQAQSKGRLKVNYLDPDANGGALAQEIAQNYGFQPMATSLFSNESFYFYLTLAKGDQIMQIPLEEMSKESFERNFKGALQRFASGFTKKVALVTPPAPNPQMAMYGMQQQGGAQYRQLQQFIGAELNIESEDLSDGRVAGDADILVLMAPKELDEKQLFAVDQFLMQGGTVIAATSPFAADLNRRSMTLKEQSSGMEAWLKHHGIEIDNTLVLDTQNSAFPVPVMRNVGGFQLQDMRMVDYPFFIDVRDEGLNQDNLITSELPQLTLAWASPIRLDEEANKSRSVTKLIESSDSSWVSTNTDIMPKIEEGQLSTYTPTGEQSKKLLGVISQGQFSSYFSGKESPLLAKEESQPEEGAEQEAEEKKVEVSSVIEKSSNAARIIVFSSNDFLRDQVVGMLGSTVGSQYLNSLQMVANTVDWSLEDSGLLSIRSRGHFNRTLPPMERSSQVFWEYLNYGLAALALILIALYQRLRHKSRQREFKQLIAA